MTEVFWCNGGKKSKKRIFYILEKYFSKIFFGNFLKNPKNPANLPDLPPSFTEFTSVIYRVYIRHLPSLPPSFLFYLRYTFIFIYLF